MSILNRTVYYDNSRGRAMFWDWASVTTTLGEMVEPFIAGAKFATNRPTVDFDPEDEIARIDIIRAMPLHKEQIVLSGGDGHLNGGVLVPRLGR
jgi:hypothetical protein